MLIVKWQRERFHLNFPPPSTKLGELRKYVSEQTGMPPDSFKILYAGGIMKDDNAPLSAYSIEDGRTIHIVGSADPLPARPSQPIRDVPSKPTETSVIAIIHGELNAIHNSIGPALKSFVDNLNRTSDTSPSPKRSELEFEHKRIGELLLQSLLRLDALTPDGQWAEARSERKKAVKIIQNMLDELDANWKNAQTSDTGATAMTTIR